MFIDTECSRSTARASPMISDFLCVRVLWNVAFQTLKEKGDCHGNGTGGVGAGVPWELKGQQNFKHLQLKKRRGGKLHHSAKSVYRNGYG